MTTSSSNSPDEKDFGGNGDIATNAPSHESQPSYLQNYGPLAHVNTAESRLPAFGGEMQPGLYKNPKHRKIGNAAPLGLCAFGLTTFLLGTINMGTLGITKPYIVVGPAYAYGGLIQLLAGMWEIASGNTFAATALSSYGGLWISLAITFTPGGFKIIEELEKVDNGSPGMFYDSFALYLFGWFIFTTICLFCTFKSTLVFCLLFFWVDIALLLLGIAYLYRVEGESNKKLLKAGGLFALLGAFFAWYCAYAGMADDSNSFWTPPVYHFPWSERGRPSRRKDVESSA